VRNQSAPATPPIFSRRASLESVKAIPANAKFHGTSVPQRRSFRTQGLSIDGPLTSGTPLTVCPPFDHDKSGHWQSSWAQGLAGGDQEDVKPRTVELRPPAAFRSKGAGANFREAAKKREEKSVRLWGGRTPAFLKSKHRGGSRCSRTRHGQRPISDSLPRSTSRARRRCLREVYHDRAIEQKVVRGPGWPPEP